VPEVGILIIDDDVTSQQALKLILDSEGWRVRIVPSSSQAMSELATGNWDLAIVNVALLDTAGPLFATLTELAQAQALVPDAATSTVAEPQHQQQRKRFRALFLVPLMGSKEVPLLLERLGLPYSFTPYHLHDFLEKVSELLVESGSILESLRSVSGFETKKRRGLRSSRDAHTSKKMFASREDYQMTEEEMADYERQEKEEEERKKRAKQLLNRQPFD
jgi:CheY-like chemotaxis protein